MFIVDILLYFIYGKKSEGHNRKSCITENGLQHNGFPVIYYFLKICKRDF